MSDEFYKRYRPKSLKAVLGQDGAVSSLLKFVEKGNFPHAMLFSGPSGVGKTTLARIVKDAVGCGEQDFVEVNCADFKGIDMIRSIRQHANLAPLFGTSRCWLIDEAHKLTGDAQNAFLKLLEDTPKHVYFMLATTDAQKLIKAIHGRCTEIKLSGMGEPALRRVLQRVVDKEQLTVSEDVLKEIAEGADGSARKALVILEQVCYLDGAEAQLAAVSASTVNKDLAISLARELISPVASWPKTAAILKELKDEPESIRYLVLGYARSVLLGGGKLAPRAFMIIDIFSNNFYDSKQAGLAAACWEVIVQK